MDLTPILLQRIDTTAELVANIKPDQLTDGTPCTGWDVRDLVNHFIGGQLGIAMAIEGAPLDPRQKAPDLLGQAGDDPAAAVEPAVKQAKSAWTKPGVLDQESVPVGQGMPPTFALRIALAEAVVHGWDIAKATHQQYEIPDMLAGPMLDGMRKTFGDAPRGPDSFFGQPVEVPETAPLADQLLGFLGRKP